MCIEWNGKSHINKLVKFISQVSWVFERAREPSVAYAMHCGDLMTFAYTHTLNAMTIDTIVSFVFGSIYKVTVPLN